ncbi:hypothetical protein ACF0H5_019186 [Mactra antiquata]
MGVKLAVTAETAVTTVRWILLLQFYLTVSSKINIPAVEIEADDTSPSTSSCNNDDTVKEIQAFQKFCENKNFSARPVLVRQDSHRGVYSFYKQSSRSPHHILPLRLSRDSESSVATILLSRQVSDAHEFSTGYVDFLCKITESLYSSGNRYIKDCPQIRELPIYLSIGGAAGFLKIVMIFLRPRKFDQKKKDVDMSEVVTDVVLQRYVRYTNNLLTVFLPIWFVLGNYWYFSNPTPNFEPILSEPTKWCSDILYEFVNYKLVFSYVLVLFMVICVVFLTIAYNLLGESELFKSGFIN